MVHAWGEHKMFFLFVFSLSAMQTTRSQPQEIFLDLTICHDCSVNLIRLKPIVDSIYEVQPRARSHLILQMKVPFSLIMLLTLI